MSFFQNCMGAVTMLTPSSRRVQPLINEIEEDPDYEDDVFISMESSLDKRHKRRYCGWAAFFRRDSQRMMIISAPILDPNQMFPKEAMRYVDPRSKSDSTWQNKSSLVPAVPLTPRRQSDILPQPYSQRRTELMVNHNKPDLILHGGHVDRQRHQGVNLDEEDFNQQGKLSHAIPGYNTRKQNWNDIRHCRRGSEPIRKMGEQPKQGVNDQMRPPWQFADDTALLHGKAAQKYFVEYENIEGPWRLEDTHYYRVSIRMFL